MAGDPNQANKILVNRYKILELIGQGAMGTVYRAEDLFVNNLNVAIKFLSRSLDDHKMIQRFQREATISALLSERSINIVKVTDYGVDDNQAPFYVMEFLEGESLSEIIQFHKLTILQFLNFTRQICLAMETAHNGIFFEGEICPIIHRDIKPSNIYVTEDQEKGELIKVLDFGIAKLLQNESVANQSFMGTPKYCSPEQIQGEELDNRSDIYSFGILMYEMLTKKMPWQIEDNSFSTWHKIHTQMIPEEFEPKLKIPPELQKLIMLCLAKSPNDRPQSVGDIIQQLDSIGRKIKPRGLQKGDTITSPILNAVTGEHSISELEQTYLDSFWPKNKPQQKIVFPRLTIIEKDIYPSLWTMLDEKDINNRKDNICHNEFLFKSYPYPMILWITVLYNLEHGPRWLPCYLDLKTKIGQQVTKILGDSKEYYILLFALNKPKQCQHFLSAKILLKQRTSLKQWGDVAKKLSIPDSTQSVNSKKTLKHEFEEIKPRIILDIQKNTTTGRM